MVMRKYRSARSAQAVAPKYVPKEPKPFFTIDPEITIHMNVLMAEELLDTLEKVETLSDAMLSLFHRIDNRLHELDTREDRYDDEDE